MAVYGYTMIILGIYDYCIMTNRTNNTNNNNIDNACFVIKNIIFIYLKKKICLRTYLLSLVIFTPTVTIILPWNAQL